MAHPSNSRVTSRPARACRVITRIVSSPATVPTTIRQLGVVDRERQRLGLPRVGPQHQQLLHEIDAAQVLHDGPPQGRVGQSAGALRRAGPFVRAVTRALDELQLLDVTRDCGLRGIESAFPELLPERVLAADGFVRHQIEDGRLPVALHKYGDYIQ